MRHHELDPSQTGSLAPQMERRMPERAICWPEDLPEERKAKILADRRFIRYLAGQPPHEQVNQISSWRPPVDPVVEAARQAEKEAARERREAEVAPFRHPEQLRALFRSLEAKVIEQGVRITELESMQPKSKVVGRIVRQSSTGPEEAA